jgi:hypothetical protein
MNKNIKTSLIVGGEVVAIPIIFSLVPGLLGWHGYGGTV